MDLAFRISIIPDFLNCIADSLVSLAAVFSIVTQRGEERCVTILKTAARETTDSPT